jgi:hypothetical protein
MWSRVLQSGACRHAGRRSVRQVSLVNQERIHYSSKKNSGGRWWHVVMAPQAPISYACACCLGVGFGFALHWVWFYSPMCLHHAHVPTITRVYQSHPAVIFGTPACPHVPTGAVSGHTCSPRRAMDDWSRSSVTPTYSPVRYKIDSFRTQPVSRTTPVEVHQFAPHAALISYQTLTRQTLTTPTTRITE